MKRERASVEIAVIQRRQDGRGRVLFAERRGIAVARALSEILDCLAAEAAVYRFLDPVVAARAESDAIRLGRLTRAAVRMK